MTTPKPASAPRADRVSEIEDAIAAGTMSAAQVFTQMRQLVAASAQVREVEALTVENAPIGTRAPAIGGGSWYRSQRGWTWNEPCGAGSTFPRPGADWNGKLILPAGEPAAEPAPCTAADDTPSKSRAKRIRLEKGESVAVAQGDGIDWRGFGKYSTEQVVAGLNSWMLDSMEREAWNDGDRGTYRYRAGLLQKAIATIADHARIVAELESEAARLHAEWSIEHSERSAAEASLAACRALVPKWRSDEQEGPAYTACTIGKCADELQFALRQEAPHAE